MSRLYQPKPSHAPEPPITTSSFNRRSFILGALTFPIIASSCSKPSQEIAHAHLKEPFKTLHIIQNHLWPKREGIPSLEQINALNYLKNMLDTHYTHSVSRYLKKAVIWVDEESQEQYKKAFFSLNYTEQASLLKSINNTPWGEGILSTILTRTIIEPLLCDPLYTQNSDSLGWKWLEHQAGFPRPSKPFWEMHKNV
jgi:gluconate 2-dehydrogenase gamma chain